MRTTDILAGAAAAAVATYFLDPDSGRRRRALARDQLSSAMRELERASEAVAVDMKNRSRGLMADARRLDVMQERWSPATRALAGGLGATLVACAITKPSVLTTLLAIGGVAIATRAGTNRSLGSFVARATQAVEEAPGFAAAERTTPGTAFPVAPLPDETTAV